MSALLSLTAAARGRSAGVAAEGCDICHSGGQVPTVSLTAEPLNPAVGQAVTLTISVTQTNGAVAGFYLTTAYTSPGSFKAIESGTSALGAAVMHSSPRSGTGGVTTFKTQWTASEATGVEFDVFALSANGDRSTRGDGAGADRLELLVGCSGGTFYIDQDRDGYGSADPLFPPRQACSAPDGYAPTGGDCDDLRAQVHPDAAEQCDLKDNDCDGRIDEDVVDQPYCEDQDGDGHGRADGMTKIDCKPSEGFGACDDDCDDRDADQHPGAVEVCDGFDNDCNGKVDERVRPICGVGLCSRYANGCGATCTPGEPFPESCNGYDDDCDGAVDNGDNRALCGELGLTCLAGLCVGTPEDPPLTGGAPPMSPQVSAEAPAKGCSLAPRGTSDGSRTTAAASLALAWLAARRRSRRSRRYLP